LPAKTVASNSDVCKYTFIYTYILFVCLNTPLFACQDCRTRPYVCIHTQIYNSFKKYKYKYIYEFRGTTLRLPRLSTLILMHICTYRYNLYVYTFAHITNSPIVVYTNPHINEYLFKNAIWLEAQRDALQHTATHYLAARQKIIGGLVRGWRHIVTRCNTLQHTATGCNTPWRRVKRL